MQNPIAESIFSSPSEFPVRVLRQRGEASSSRPLTYHREVEIQFVRSGGGSYLIGGVNYAFKANSLLLIRPFEVHRLIGAAGTVLDKSCLLFPATLLGRESRLLDLPQDFPHHVRLSEREATEMEMLLRNISDETEQRQSEWTSVVQADLIRLTVLAGRAGSRGQAPPEEGDNDLVRSVVSYMEDNFSLDLSLDSLALKFSLSAGYLSRLFKAYTGVNPKQYILQRRIVESKRLLESESNLKIYVIAQAVGFNDFVTFNRNFKRFTGMTPAAYRSIYHPENRNCY